MITCSNIEVETVRWSVHDTWTLFFDKESHY